MNTIQRATNTLFKIIIIYIFIIPAHKSYAQIEILDTNLHRTLSNYLLKHPRLVKIDSNGNETPLSRYESINFYENHILTAVNLRYDSTYSDKSIIGIYRFGYVGEPQYLYLKYRDHIEFVDLDKKTFRLENVLKKTYKFFRKSASFTEEEKVKMLKGVIEVIHSKLYEEISW